MSQLRLMLTAEIIADFINQRGAHYEPARLLMTAGKVGEFDLWLPASQMTDLVYGASNGEDPALLPDVLRKLRGLCSFIKMAQIGAAEVSALLNTDWPHPEDALVHEAALQVRAQAIITRDADFAARSQIPAMDCQALFEKLKAEQGLIYDVVSL